MWMPYWHSLRRTGAAFPWEAWAPNCDTIREAVNAGTGVYMLHGRHPERIALLLEGREEGAGTYFVPKGGSHEDGKSS